MNFDFESIKSEIRIEQIQNEVFHEESFSSDPVNDYIENDNNFSITKSKKDKNNSITKNSQRNVSKNFINKTQIGIKDSSIKFKQRKSCMIPSNIGIFSQTLGDNLIANKY